jgi:hypothetical protein
MQGAGRLLKIFSIQGFALVVGLVKFIQGEEATPLQMTNRIVFDSIASDPPSCEIQSVSSAGCSCMLGRD